MKKALSLAVMLLTLCFAAADLGAQQSAPTTLPVRGRVHPSSDVTRGSLVPGLPGLPPIARGNQARLTGRSAQGNTIILTTAIAPDGSFEFPDVPRGEYQVTVLPTSLPAAAVVVGDGVVPGLELGDVPARLTGSVMVEGGGPQPPFQLEFTKDAALHTLVAAAPAFAAELPQGSFSITARGLPAGFSIRSMTAGAADLTRQPLALRSGETVRLAVVVAAATPSPWVRASGRVAGSVGPTPVNTIRLAGPAIAGVLTARVSADGTFEIPQLLPGQYEARLVPSPIHFVSSITVGAADTRGITITAPSIKGLVGEFISIPPGEFLMGCSPGDAACEPAELPAHRVAITRGFEIGKYEVTQAQWEAVMGTNPSQFKGRDRPVDNINTWVDAREFIDKLNAVGDGYRYRLPTEAEWEYAARAGSSVPHPGGVDAVSWYQSNAGGQSHPVGQKQPNAWGLYDTLGNVAEWVEDWHSTSYYGESPAVDPLGPLTGSVKVVRGGASGHNPNWVRVSHRRVLPAAAYGGFGLRLVREAVR
jgi:formylglycine-generating enzyme required for sulfatase activity